MNKAHLTLLALLVAGATVLGAIAVTRTTGLGRAARQTNDAAVIAQTKQLNAFAAKLQPRAQGKTAGICRRSPSHRRPRRQLRRHPHRRLHRTIVYHQPPPVVVTIHRHHGDDGSEGDGGGGGGDD